MRTMMLAALVAAPAVAQGGGQAMDREALREKLRAGMQVERPIAQIRAGSTRYVCADGALASFARDRRTQSAEWAKGEDKRTLFRLIDPAGARTAGARFAADGLTVTDLGGEIAVQQAPNPAYRCWIVPLQPTPGVLTGTASYRVRMALPAGSKLSVTLADVSLADAPRREIASVKLSPGGQAPIHWLIRYDPAAVTPRPMTYAVSARIEGPDGRLLFVTDMRNTVLEASPAPPPVALRLVPVGRGG